MLGNVTKAEAVYRETRWRIITGALPPATAVNQAELAGEFGVSQTPVREALLRLESEGLVVFLAHSMVKVSPLDLQELDELYAIRVELDSFAGGSPQPTARPRTWPGSRTSSRPTPRPTWAIASIATSTSTAPSTGLLATSS